MLRTAFPLLCLCLFVLGACSGADEGAALDVCVERTCPDDHVCGDSGCERVDTPRVTGDLGRYTATGRTSAGTRVIATFDSTHKNLVVIQDRADGTTKTEVVDGWRIVNRQAVEVDAGSWLDLAVDDADGLHLVWYHADEGALKYGFSPGDGRWEIETIDGEGAENRGTHASIALHDGRAHVAYRDEGARALRYARRDATGTWNTRALSSCAGEIDCPSADEDFGEWASVAVIGGRPRVAFYDRLRGDLKVTSVDVEGVWETTTLDGRDPITGEDTGDVGRFVTLELNAIRVPGLAYFDATRGALRFVKPGETPIVVDAGVYLDTATTTMKSRPVGQHVALRFDPQGRAIMLYLDGGRPGIKLAVVSDGAVRQVRDLSVPPGGFLSFELNGEAGSGSLDGALGAWVVGEAPRSALHRFTVAVDVP